MIGVDISDQTIKVAQLSNGRNKKILSHCMHVLPNLCIVNGVVADKKQLAEELTKALVSCRVNNGKKDTLVVSIPETQSFLRIIEMPTMTDDEVDEAIRFEIAQHIPFSVDSVYIDWQSLSPEGHKPNPGHREIQVGAAQKKVVDPLYEVMQSAGLDVAAFELESQAIVRALISPELHAKRGVLIVDFGSTATNVIVHDNGVSRFTASLLRGVSHITSALTSDDAKQVMEKLHELPDDLTERISGPIVPEMNKLVVDIRGVVDYYNNIDHEHRVKEVILTGGGSNLPGLDTAFLDHFEDIHIQRGNPWVNILKGENAMHPPMNIKESVRYTTALGLALRSVVHL